MTRRRSSLDVLVSLILWLPPGERWRLWGDPDELRRFVAAEQARRSARRKGKAA